MINYDDIRRAINDEEQGMAGYMVLAARARNAGDTESSLEFEDMAKDEMRHKDMLQAMEGRMSKTESMPAMEYYWAVEDRTSGEKTTDGTRYNHTSIAVAAARKYITEDLAVREDILGHDIDIEVYISAPDVRGFTIGDPFHTEKYIHLETTPLAALWRMPESGTVFPGSFGDWIELAELIKGKVPGLTNETNEHLNTILLTPEDADVDVAKQWLVNKGRDLGIR